MTGRRPPIQFTALLGTATLAMALAACGGPGGPGGKRGGPSGDRAQAERDPALTHGALVVKPEALLISDLDANGDRVTDRAELTRALPALFAEIDSDGSRVIGGIEYAGWAETALGSRYPVLGLAHFDADNSLSIEPAEFDTGMQALFTRLDTDSDNRITRTDLFTTLDMPASGARGGMAGGRGDRGGGGGGGRPRGPQRAG